MRVHVYVKCTLYDVGIHLLCGMLCNVCSTCSKCCFCVYSVTIDLDYFNLCMRMYAEYILHTILYHRHTHIHTHDCDKRRHLIKNEKSFFLSRLLSSELNQALHVWSAFLAHNEVRTMGGG